jgi:broad specificity phosphatase PhoE
MPKTIWMFRAAKHAADPENPCIWQPGATLDIQVACRQIEAAVKHLRLLGVEPVVFRHSVFTRAYQTCSVFAQAFGKSDIALKANLGPGDTAEWNRLMTEWHKQNPNWGESFTGPTNWINAFPMISTEDGIRILSAVRDIATEIKDGEHAIAVSHNPLIRIAEGILIGEWDKIDLVHCQAVRFTVDGDHLSASPAPD